MLACPIKSYATYPPRVGRGEGQACECAPCRRPPQAAPRRRAPRPHACHSAPGRTSESHMYLENHPAAVETPERLMRGGGLPECPSTAPEQHTDAAPPVQAGGSLATYRVPDAPAVAYRVGTSAAALPPHAAERQHDPRENRQLNLTAPHKSTIIDLWTSTDKNSPR